MWRFGTSLSNDHGLEGNLTLILDALEPKRDVVQGFAHERYPEIEAFWDGLPNCNTIDDAGIRAYYPLTKDFIKTPDNSFIGE